MDFFSFFTNNPQMIKQLRAESRMIALLKADDKAIEIEQRMMRTLKTE